MSAYQVITMMHALKEPKDEVVNLLHPIVNKKQSDDIENCSLQILYTLSHMMDSTKENYKTN